MQKHTYYKKACWQAAAMIGSLSNIPFPLYAATLTPGEDFIVLSGETELGALGITVNGLAGGSVTNFGTITSETNYGIYIYNGGSDLTAGITNNSDALLYGNSSAIMVNNYGSITGNINNGGTINGGNAGISFQENTSGSIINNIGGVISGVNFGVDNSATMSGAITNNSGATITGGHAGILLSSASDVAGGITNAGTISISPGGTLGAISITGSRVSGGITNTGTIDGNGGAAIQMGTLTGATNIILNGGRVLGDITDTTSSTGRSIVSIVGDFKTQGNIRVSDLTVSAGQIFSVSANNAVTLYDMSMSSGTWSFDINAQAPSSRLIVTNGDIDLTGATFSTSQIHGSLKEGDTIILVEGNAAVTGGPGGVPRSIADQSALWDFQMVDGTYGAIGGDATDLYLLVTEGGNGSISDIAEGGNATIVGEVLEGLNETSNPELSNIISDINNAKSDEELNDIINSVHISPNRSLVTNSKSISARTRSIINNRLSVKRTGLSSGDDYDPSGMNDGSFWAQAHNSKVKQGMRKNISGYDSSTTGLSFGVDTEGLHENLVLGLSVSYSQTDVNGKDINHSSTDIDSYQVTVYGDYDLDEDIFVMGTAGYVYSKNETKRYHVGGANGLTAYGDYASHYGFVGAEIGRTFQKSNCVITPAVTAFYGRHKSNDYIEKGVGGANLDVNNKGINILELGMKVDTEWDYEFDNGSILKPSLHLGYSYDVVGDAVETTSKFTGGGASFTNKGFDPAQGAINLGLGIAYERSEEWIFEAGYDIEYKEDHISNSFLIKAQYKF